MPFRDEIKTYAKLVAKDMRAGKAPSHSHQASGFMEAAPEALLDVLDLVHREAGRKKPDEEMIRAYLLMFAHGLEQLRYQIERGRDWAGELVDTVRERISESAEDGAVSPDLLMLLLNGFIDAKLDPGDDLTELLAEVAQEAAEQEPMPSPSDIGEMFESMVRQAGGNEFEVYAGFVEIGQTLPPEFRQAASTQMATSENPVVRETATLYLLDPAPAVRRTVCRTIAENASPSTVSPVGLRRMIALRNWLPGNERHHLDAAIKRARQKEVECAPWPRKKTEEILASNIDGAGAQSVFAVAREGRRRLIAGLLVKRGVGIADAWCLRGQTKAEVRDFFDHVTSHMESHSVGPGFLDMLIPHYLAVGRKNGNLPTAGLLDFLESTGVEKWHPAELSIDDLIALLEQDVDPARLGRRAADKAVAASGRWRDEFGFMDSWFEDDAEVEAVLSKKPGSAIPARVDAIIESILEPRRAKWADRFLWTALWSKQKQGSAPPWAAFLAVGRELHRGRPVTDIPVMRGIAEATVMSDMMRF